MLIFFSFFFPCVDAQVSCRDGSWSKINVHWVIWVRGGGLTLQDPKPPMNPKETSLTIHLDASMKMYDIDYNDFTHLNAFKYIKCLKNYNLPVDITLTGIRTSVHFDLVCLVGFYGISTC